MVEYVDLLRSSYIDSFLELSDNGIVSSYAKGVYNYYDFQQIEEFVAFKGAYEIASLIEKYDATLSQI